MLEKAVSNIVAMLIRKSYPDAMYPALMKAKIVSKKENVEYNTYSVRTIDSAGNYDDNYPIFPNIKSKIMVDVGDIVVIGNIRGNYEIEILSEVII